MDNNLNLVFIRNSLSHDIYNDETLKMINNIYKKLFLKEDNIHKFMYEMITLAKKDIDKQNYSLASFDFDLIHNFPIDNLSKWNEKYFYGAKFLDYCEQLVELEQLDKMKKVFNLVNVYLID